MVLTINIGSWAGFWIFMAVLVYKDYIKFGKNNKKQDDNTWPTKCE